MSVNSTVPLRPRINMLNPGEVNEWSRKLGITRERLAAAIKEVGNNANEVILFLKKGLRKAEMASVQPLHGSIL